MKLNFFTANYPFGKGEYIIENELPILCDKFDEIKIFSHSKDNSEKRELPCHTDIVSLKDFKVEKLSFKYLFIVFHFFIIELIKSNNKWFYIKHSKKWLSLLKQGAQKARYIENNNLLLPNAINYSFWMNDWALVLTFLKRRQIIHHFIFRCGGFDIWNERHDGNYLPFRGLIYKYADGVFPNTKIAEQYIKSLNVYPQKVKGHYLGTSDYGMGKFVPKSNEITLISVSNVIPIKRIDLIVKVLRQVKIKVNWFHFGEGESLKQIKETIKNQPLIHHIEFKGQVTNADILEFYQNNSVDMFISMSSTEGLPVSIQEAISFGVPIIATNVGGVSEIVNEKTGYLIDEDVNIEQVANYINNFKSSKYNTIEQRNIIRAFWSENFNAEIVYNQFFDEIKDL